MIIFWTVLALRMVANSPRKHIRTVVASLDEVRSDQNVCPRTKTDTEFTGSVAQFIGQDYKFL